MCSISTRLDTLNRQLMIISKLQNMDKEFDVHPHMTHCKKCNMQNFNKLCHCAYHISSLKEQCDRLNYVEECISCDNARRNVPCNARTCKMHKKFVVCRNSRFNGVQTDSMDDEQALKTGNVRMKGDKIRQDPLPTKEKQKSDQTNSSLHLLKPYTKDKKMDTFEEKNEQTIPTKDNFHIELSTNTSNINNAQLEATAKGGKVQTVVDQNVMQEMNELKEVYSTQDIPIKDKKMFERIQKDLLNERKRTEELEKKLESLTCSINCLKENSEQKAACLKGALEMAEEQTKFAMDLVKRSKDQTDIIETDRNELLSEITKLQQQIVEATHANTTLTQERDTLKNRLESLTEDESKRCEEVEQEVNRMKCAVKVKENALNEVKAKFMDMIMELMNVIKIQKRRISEVTDICNNQQHVIYEKDEQLSQKITELLEVQNMLLSSNSTCKEMEEQVEHLRQCLCEETSACDCLKQELEVFKENHLSKMRIKEKIVDEQNKTISRQRKLLHDSEKMVQQVASEFDQLKAELCEEKQKNKFLQIKLDKTDNELSNAYLLECKKCRILKSKIDCLKTEKQRALTIAKFAYQKLNQSMKEYQKQLFCKEEQYRRMTLIVDKKEKEIRCLKTQIYQNSLKPIKEMNSCTL